MSSDTLKVLCQTISKTQDSLVNRTCAKLLYFSPVSETLRLFTSSSFRMQICLANFIEIHLQVSRNLLQNCYDEMILRCRCSWVLYLARCYRRAWVTSCSQEVTLKSIRLFVYAARFIHTVPGYGQLCTFSGYCHVFILGAAKNAPSPTKLQFLRNHSIFIRTFSRLF